MYLVRNFRNGHAIGIVFEKDGTIRLMCAKSAKSKPRKICNDCQVGVVVALGRLLQQDPALNGDG